MRVNGGLLSSYYRYVLALHHGRNLANAIALRNQPGSLWVAHAGKQAPPNMALGARGIIIINYYFCTLLLKIRLADLKGTPLLLHSSIQKFPIGSTTGRRIN